MPKPKVISGTGSEASGARGIIKLWALVDPSDQSTGLRLPEVVIRSHLGF